MALYMKKSCDVPERVVLLDKDDYQKCLSFHAVGDDKFASLVKDENTLIIEVGSVDWHEHVLAIQDIKNKTNNAKKSGVLIYDGKSIEDNKFILASDDEESIIDSYLYQRFLILMGLARELGAKRIDFEIKVSKSESSSTDMKMAVDGIVSKIANMGASVTQNEREKNEVSAKFEKEFSPVEGLTLDECITNAEEFLKRREVSSSGEFRELLDDRKGRNRSTKQTISVRANQSVVSALQGAAKLGVQLSDTKLANFKTSIEKTSKILSSIEIVCEIHFNPNIL